MKLKVFLFLAIVSAFLAGQVYAGDKVYVCKYVGTPGVDETLQTGQNPIEVSVNALPEGWSIGGYFNDNQGRSYVLATVPQIPEPDASDCPSGTNPSPTPTATPVPTATPSITPVPTATPVATVTPTATPTDVPCEDRECNETPTPTATPVTNNDICANIDGVQTSLPEGSHLDASGKNCVWFGVPGVPESPKTSSTGQVLGASTMAGTGIVEEAFFNSIFALGSFLTSFGIMKNAKKRN